MVKPEIITRITPQLDPDPAKTLVNKIMRATKPVAFELTDRYAVTGKGAPS